MRGESCHVDKIPVKYWNAIVEVTRRAEIVFRSFANTEDIQHIDRASELLQFQTIRATTPKTEEIFANT